MLAIETIREDAWLRAYEASRAQGNDTEASMRHADTVLTQFDRNFPKHSASDADLPFGR
jgi:hypothetical protein